MNASLLAQHVAPRTERIRGIHTRFADADPNATWHVTLVIIMLVALILLVWMVYRIQRRRGESKEQSPMGLFWKVLARLGLPMWDRIRLWHVAHVLQIRHPTALLISAGQFDEAARRYLRGPGMIRMRTGAAQQFAAVREELFGQSAE
jgi:hypothetical protein